MKLNKLLLSLLLVSIFGFTASVSANTQALGTCLTDSLNGKERKLLVKWIYFAMANHPELIANSSISNEDRVNSDKAVGVLITRLFIQDCPEEAKLAQKSDPLAIQKAFEFVGQVAMGELMTNEKVMSGITNYVQYTDQNKITELFVE